MVNLSSAAATKLQSIMDEKKLDGYGLRIFVSGGGCGGLQYGMGFDAKSRSGDAIETVEGISVFVDPMSAQYLDGVNVDYVDALMGGGFKIENPNAISTCSCGSSFKTEGEGAVKSSCHH